MGLHLVVGHKMVCNNWLRAASLAFVLSALPISLHIDFGNVPVSLEFNHAAAEEGNSGPNSGGNSGNGGGNSGSDDNGDNDGNSNQSGKSGKTNRFKGGEVYSEDGKIVVSYSDGFKEQIVHGMYKLTDPKGRVIAERVASRTDRVRLKALMN